MDEPNLPLQSPAAERSLLGAMLRSADVIAEHRDRVPTECFYLDAHQKICDAIYSLYDRRANVDANTVSLELQKAGTHEDAGGTVYLGELWAAAATSGSAEYYSKIILEKYKARRLIALLQENLGQLYDCIPTEDVVGQIGQGIDRITSLTAGIEGVTIQESSKLVMENIDARSRGERPATLPTGFPGLDDHLCGGLRNGGLTVLAARTSKGKTAFALAIARNTCKAGRGVFFVSLEQSHDEITERHFAALSGVSGRRIIAGDLKPEHIPKILEANDTVQPWQFVVDDRRNLSASQIAAAARRQVRKFKCPTLIVVDYLSLIRADDPRAQRYMQVGDTVKKLRSMAGILNVPVLLLAQLNREAKDDEVTEIRHIRESGDVEQDADAILLIHQETDETTGQPLEKFRLIIGKQRNGPKGNIALIRHAATFDFKEAEEIPT